MNEDVQGQGSAPNVRVHNKRSITGGLILIVLGGLFLAENLIPGVHFGDYWPLLLIAIGIGLLWNARWKT